MPERQMKTVAGLVGAAIAFCVSVAIPGSVRAGEELLHSWNERIEGTKRFVVLADFDDRAVLDRETGLVWEQSPSADAMNWFDAKLHCYNLVIGGRKGWRLPTVEQLTSLVDDAQTFPALPVGHPFVIVAGFQWTAITTDVFPDAAWAVSFFNGVVNAISKGSPLRAWCARGGQG